MNSILKKAFSNLNANGEQIQTVKSMVWGPEERDPIIIIGEWSGFKSE